MTIKWLTMSNDDFFEEYGFNYTPICKHKQAAQQAINKNIANVLFRLRMTQIFSMGGLIPNDDC
jgi:hypothetical protein